LELNLNKDDGRDPTLFAAEEILPRNRHHFEYSMDSYHWITYNKSTALVQQHNFNSKGDK
jgi:hypothetical protein